MNQVTLQKTEQEVNMPLIKVIRHGQITLPAGFRKTLEINVGDYLEAFLEKDTIVLRPKVVLDKGEAIRALHQIMDNVQSRTQEIDAETIEQEVASAITDVRKKKRHA